MNFKISIHKPVLLAAISLMALVLSNNAAAFSNTNTTMALLNSISALCPNGTKQPLPSVGSCSSCHTSPPALNAYGSQIKSIDPALCNPATTTNQPPVAVINSPANNSTVTLGNTGTVTVNFIGTGTDPDNNTPLKYAWTFAGGGASVSTSTVTNPTVTFSTAATALNPVKVTFTVTDSKGLASTTQTRNLTVNPAVNQPPVAVITPPSFINVGAQVIFDGGIHTGYAWTFAGGTPSTSSAQKPQVTFSSTGTATVTLRVTDNGSSSTLASINVTVLPAIVPPPPSSCTDKDQDMFNAEGGFCGPKDCVDDPAKNPLAAAINPGAIEICSDKIDNDCNGKTDSEDLHCNGGECVAQLLNKIEITSAAWEQEDRELSVNGPWTTAGDTVRLFDSLLNTALGSTKSTKSGWSFNLEELRMAPCRVRVEINGRSGERDVAYAPSNCSGKPAATNKPPVAIPDTATTPENFSVDIPVLENDSDPDGDKLTITVVTKPRHGDVTQNGSILTYKPTTGYSGSDSFTYVIIDGHGGTATATVTISVVNQAPSAQDDTKTTQENVPVTIAVLANDTDPENDPLSIRGFTSPGHGIVTNNSVNLIYTPTSGYSGSDSFTYTISDGHGNTANATVTVTVQKAVSTPIKVVIGSATWNSSDKKLLVSGSGGVRGASVKIFNATTKATLGTTSSEDDGKWKKTIEKPSVVPCKVRVEITKGSQTGFAEKTVANAPRTCDTNTNRSRSRGD